MPAVAQSGPIRQRSAVRWFVAHPQMTQFLYISQGASRSVTVDVHGAKPASLVVPPSALPELIAALAACLTDEERAMLAATLAPAQAVAS